MFTLVKKSDGQYNTMGDPHSVEVTALSSDTAAGTPVTIVGGAVTAITAASATIATHIVVADAKSGATVVDVIDILPDMVFRTTVGTTGSVYKIGSEIPVASGKVNLAALDTGKRGVLVYETPSATAAGSPILVKFPTH